MPVVAAMKSNSTENNTSQNSESDPFRPMHATNIKIAKKIPASLAVEEMKGGLIIPPGQNPSDRVATGTLGEELTLGAEKYAVVIGICDYPGRDMDICFSDGDSYNMVTALIENYGYDPDNIFWFRDKGNGTETIDGNEISYGVPTHYNIRTAVMDIKSVVKSGDEVVFFFSGHGVSGLVTDGIIDEDGEYIDDNEYSDENPDEGIMVYDSDRKLDGDNYSKLDFIWDGELRSWFYAFNTDRIIFIFDTCLAGGMNDVVNDEFGSAYNNRVVIMSSGELQSSSVYSGGKYGEGMFSRHFVNEGMLQGLADGYNQSQTIDYDVAMEEAFDYAKENIPDYLEGKQTPVISDMFTNDLLLGYNL